jgi:RIO-like serine/threonine protein kinase
MTVVKLLKGFSGQSLQVIESPQGPFVRKWGSVDRNLPQLQQITQLGITTPRILGHTGDYFDMEYIQGLDMATYLLRGSAEDLLQQLIRVLSQLENTASGLLKDYVPVYRAKLAHIDQQHWADQLPFTLDQLIDRLPRHLPQSCYYGDLTLENILYSTADGQFVMIDAVTIEYDSWVFDLAKLRQDISCGWFLRDSDSNLEAALNYLEQQLQQQWPQYWLDHCVILMLLRVLKYAEAHSREEIFLLEWINRLWK